MNDWGPEGCRLHYTEIVTTIEDDAKKYRWHQQVTAAGRAALNGFAFRVNWFNPIPYFVDEAIRLASVE